MRNNQALAFYLRQLSAGEQYLSTLALRYTSNTLLAAIIEELAPGNFNVIFFLLAYCSFNTVNCSTSLL